MSEIKRKRYVAGEKIFAVEDSGADLQLVLLELLTRLYFVDILVHVFGENVKPVCSSKGLMVTGKRGMFEYRVLHTFHCHTSLFYPINPVLCDPDVQQPAPARLPCPLRPVSAFICASQVTKRPSQWINIKILFQGIRLGNILPSNAALARAKARQGINY